MFPAAAITNRCSLKQSVVIGTHPLYPSLQRVHVLAAVLTYRRQNFSSVRRETRSADAGVVLGTTSEALNVHS